MKWKNLLLTVNSLTLPELGSLIYSPSLDREQVKLLNIKL